jgi:type IV pilus assembly protein PilM
MLQEVSRAVQLFYTTTQFNWVDSLWLAGRGAVTPGLLECLRERGGFNAALLDGLPMFSGVGSDSLKEVSTSMFLAFGLGLNFFLVQK